MKNINVNEKGRSMVEMLGVLAIIGVLSAGGLAGYSKAMLKHKLNTTIDQITMIVTNVRTLYGTQGNYNGLHNGMAVKAGIVPTSMYTAASSYGSTTQLINPFKGAVSIASTDITNTPDGGFRITYNGLPSEACVQIATSDFGTGAGSGFVGSAANEDVSQQVGAAGEGDPMQLGGENGAIAKCANPGATNSVQLLFY